MKINLFYILIGVAVITGGWGLYHTYIKPTTTPRAQALTAIIGTSKTAPASALAINTTTPMQAITPKSTTKTSLPIAGQTNKTTTASAVASAAGPTAPAGLSAISTTDTSVVLSWGASYDATGIAGYKIFMNGNEIGTVASQRFEVQKLQASTAYTFAVSAYNQKGETSASSTSITATTHAAQPIVVSSTTSSTTPMDTTPPSAPTGLTASAVSTSEIDLAWTAATDNIGVTGYKIFSGGTFIATSVGTTYKSTGLVANSTYTYTVAAYDAAGNAGPQSTSASAKTQASSGSTPPADTTAPTTSVISPLANASVFGVIPVSAAAIDNVGVVKVELYVDGTLKAVDTTAPYTYSLDTMVLPSGAHVLTTKAYDAAGNVGTSAALPIVVNNSTTATTTPSTAAPSAPTGLSATAISSTQITLTWTAPASSTSATGYQIFRNGHPLATNATTTYTDTGLTAGTTYSYTVLAYATIPDNASAQSASASATTGN